MTELSATQAPLEQERRERLRDHSALAAACVEALIACEYSRNDR